MNQNKTTKYLKYAIGEIILVVIGILIALQINNWNESRQQDVAEIEFLKGVKSDLNQDKAYMASVLNKCNSKIEAYQQLNKATSKAEIESALMAYMFVGNNTFYPISGAFQSAISGNDINTFKSKKTISLLVKLYNSTYPRLIDNASQLDSRWENLSEKYRHDRRIGYFESLTNEKLSQIKDDIYFHYIQIEWYKSVLLSANTEIDKVLKTIDEYLVNAD